MRTRHDEAFWREVMEQMERSGQTQKELARRKGVHVTTLRKWLRRLRGEQGGSMAHRSEVRLVPVEVFADRPKGPAEMAAWQTDRQQSGRLEIGLPGGWTVRLMVGTDCQYVGRLLETVRRQAGQC